MDEPKAEIYDKLSEITQITVNGTPKTVTVYQQRPEVLESFPCITFNISSNVPKYQLDKDIGRQDIVVKVDLWAETSIESGLLLIAVEAKLKELDYLLSFNSDIADPEGYSHLTTQFTY